MRISSLGRNIVAALLLLLSFGRTPQASAQTPPHVVVIRAAQMLDVASQKVVSNPVVVVEGDRIKEVGSGIAVPSGAKVLDLGNVTLMPGLIDAHTHLLMNYDAAFRGDENNMILTVAQMSPADRAFLGAQMGREDLEEGITTVRDVGNSGLNGDVALRDAIEKGYVKGPRIVASTRALSGVGGQFGDLQKAAQSLIDQEYVQITTVDDARRAVQQAFYDGANCIKVIVNTGPRVVSLDEMKAIVEEAHRVHRKVAAHAIGNDATRIAADAGVDSVEHAYVVPDDALRTMAEKKIFLVPTDYPPEVYTLLSSDPAAAAERLKQTPLPKATVATRDRIRRALAMGVRIAAGSDEYYQMGDRTRGQSSKLIYHEYRDAGMTPWQIIQAATVNDAELLGMSDRIGAIEAGKFADIIAVAGDPSKDLSSLDKVQFVMKGGDIVRNDINK
jgi:imidazolonepropionase-like amidohydrolase